MNEKTYSTKEVIEIFKVTKNIIIDLLRHRNGNPPNLIPKFPAKGSGNRVRFSETDIKRLKRYFDAKNNFEAAKRELKASQR